MPTAIPDVAVDAHAKHPVKQAKLVDIRK